MPHLRSGSRIKSPELFACSLLSALCISRKAHGTEAKAFRELLVMSQTKGDICLRVRHIKLIVGRLQEDHKSLSHPTTRVTCLLHRNTLEGRGGRENPPPSLPLAGRWHCSHSAAGWVLQWGRKGYVPGQKTGSFHALFVHVCFSSKQQNKAGMKGKRKRFEICTSTLVYSFFFRKNLL